METSSWDISLFNVEVDDMVIDPHVYTSYYGVFVDEYVGFSWDSLW